MAHQIASDWSCQELLHSKNSCTPNRPSTQKIEFDLHIRVAGDRILVKERLHKTLDEETIIADGAVVLDLFHAVVPEKDLQEAKPKYNQFKQLLSIYVWEIVFVRPSCLHLRSFFELATQTGNEDTPDSIPSPACLHILGWAVPPRKGSLAIAGLITILSLVTSSH